MGKKNPNEPYPLLYLNTRSKNLWQVKKLNPNRFKIKGVSLYLTRTQIQNNYQFYGVIDRFGVVIRYRKEGRNWVKDSNIAAFDSETRKWKTALESEAAIIKELNKMNRRNPELAFYSANNDTKNILERVLAGEGDDPNWESV